MGEDMSTGSIDEKRARLIRMARGGTGIIEIPRYYFNFGKTPEAAPAADSGPILVPLAEYEKFEAACARYRAARGEDPGGPWDQFKYEHRSHLEAVEAARKEYEEAPALVRHEDGQYYMHGENKPGRPTIIDIVITEILTK